MFISNHVLYHLIFFYSLRPLQYFSVTLGCVFHSWAIMRQRIKYLAQGHNTLAFDMTYCFNSIYCFTFNLVAWVYSEMYCADPMLGTRSPNGVNLLLEKSQRYRVSQQFIVPAQSIVTSLWNNGQPCCRSKINSTHNGKIVFFYLERLFFHVKPNMFIFLIPFMYKSWQLSRHKDAEVFRKNRFVCFLPICLLIFDPQDGWPIFQREITIGWVGNISIGPGPMKHHKATKPEFNVGSSSSHQRNAILMAFRWRANDGQCVVVFESSIPSSTKIKKKSELDPLWQNFLDPRVNVTL